VVIKQQVFVAWNMTDVPVEPPFTYKFAMECIVKLVQVSGTMGSIRGIYSTKNVDTELVSECGIGVLEEVKQGQECCKMVNVLFSHCINKVCITKRKMFLFFALDA
jgi:hypothetical protein